METDKIAKKMSGQGCLNFLTSGEMRKRLLSLLLIVVFGLAMIKTSIPLLENFLVVRKQLAHAEALVVMAGSIPERIPAAARLFQDGIAPLILLTNDGIFSAWSPEKQRNLYNVEWAESELMKMRVPEQAIVRLTYSASGSIHDALNCRKEILAQGIRSIIIVTSDYHTRRSLWTFERVLRKYPVTIGTYPAPSKVGKSSDFRKFLEFSREMIKYMYYTSTYKNID